MLAIDRLARIGDRFGSAFRHITLLELDGETLRLILYLHDGSNLRVTEQWDGDLLKRYSYYWLGVDNRLNIGWDNSPHHTRVKSFPHHKHIGLQTNVQSSDEVCLEDVMKVILALWS